MASIANSPAPACAPEPTAGRSPGAWGHDLEPEPDRTGPGLPKGGKKTSPNEEQPKRVKKTHAKPRVLQVLEKITELNRGKEKPVPT